MQENQRPVTPPQSAFQFHGHRVPFPPLSCRMGQAALDAPGVGREKDHTLHLLTEPGAAHPQMCRIDGTQIATGATSGNTLVENTHWGKLAAMFWYPTGTALRFARKPDCSYAPPQG